MNIHNEIDPWGEENWEENLNRFHQKAITCFECKPRNYYETLLIYDYWIDLSDNELLGLQL